MIPAQRVTLQIFTLGLATLAGSSWLLAQVVPDNVATAEAAGSDLRAADRAFITRTIENSRQQSELARIAASQASSSAVRELARQLAADHAAISVSLENLARRKAFALELQPTSFSSLGRDFTGLPGPGFDRDFTRHALQASQQALALCEAAVAHARDPDARQLAGSLLPMLRDHVNRATQLQKEL